MDASEDIKERADVTPYPVLSRYKGKALIDSFDEYKRIYNESLDDPISFWKRMANLKITWFAPFTQVHQGCFEEGDIRWFLNGKLNVCYNCVDRHAEVTPDKVALLWEGNDVLQTAKVTYRQLLQKVSQLANALSRAGIKKGDTVCIYMPMVIEAAYAMLACARIGAPHSVVFAGFSAEALADRINDAKCKVLLTTDSGKRGDKLIELKKTVDEALFKCNTIEKVFIHKHTSIDIPWVTGRDIWLHEAMDAERPYCPPTWLDSEDPLFLLYTSGSTGKPKGVMHTQAGYLLYASLTHQYVFDYQDGDIYACMADIGWITGHSYIVYGPLANGATSLMFESTPLYPDAGRYWDMVQRYGINSFYTAPTAIRALMKCGTEFVKPYDRSSLKVLGSVGEPINPAAWEWYYDHVGNKNSSIVDTFWQTETGGIMITPLPGATPLKPGSATLPFFGIVPVILDEKTGQVLKGNGVKGVLAISRPWPSIARTVFGDHQRYVNTYFKPYPGFYFTGDGCYRDKDGYYWIVGRVDDVLNVSGHRLGTAELESALVSHESCAEAAVIGVPHDLKGQAIFAYICLKHGYKESLTLRTDLKLQVRHQIGGIAVPDYIVFVPGLLKTRSGKIMRRLLRKIASKETNPEQLGDISTLADPNLVEQIIASVNIQAQ